MTSYGYNNDVVNSIPQASAYPGSRSTGMPTQFRSSTSMPTMPVRKQFPLLKWIIIVALIGLIFWGLK